MRTRSLLILFVLAVFSSCISDDSDTETQGANLIVGDTLPTFQVTMNDGSTIRTSDLLGGVSVVVLFSVDCGDCRVELPEVQRLWDLQLGVPIVLIARENTEEAILWCENLGQILGFNKVSILSPEEHDEMIAYVSQLTHCIAVSLMTCKDNEHLKDYTGDSFRDLTRIARINENMWTELFHMNKEPLLKEMDLFIDEITNLRNLIANDDSEAIKDKMRLSTARRSKFNSKRK